MQQAKASGYGEYVALDAAVHLFPEIDTEMTTIHRMVSRSTDNTRTTTTGPNDAQRASPTAYPTRRQASSVGIERACHPLRAPACPLDPSVALAPRSWQSQYVKRVESSYRARLNATAERICRSSARVVLVCGPSASGKTTFAKHLVENLNARGRPARVISLDNYYRSVCTRPRLQDGSIDWESIRAIDSDLVANHLRLLLEGEEVLLPVYDFAKQGPRPRDEWSRMSMASNELLVVEGIHALHPEFVQSIDSSHIYRIHVEPKVAANAPLDAADTRLVRRAVRDHLSRGRSAERVLENWASVCRGDTQNIAPFTKDCSEHFNTHLRHEYGFLCQQAICLFDSVSDARADAVGQKAKELAEALRNVTPIAKDSLPEDSLLREFVGP